MRRQLALGREPRHPPRQNLLHRGEVVLAAVERADPEAAVVGLLRRAAFEHDHRGDGVSRARGSRRRSTRSAPAGRRAPSAARRSFSASTRCWRLRSVRSLSCSSASRALRSASSYRRRLSPRCAWRSATGPSRRSSSACFTPSARAKRRRAHDLGRNRKRGRVVLDRELLDYLGLAAAGAVLEVEALAVGEHSVAHLEHLSVRVGPLDARPRSRRACRPTRPRPAGARTASAPRAGDCGRPPPARTPARRRPAPCPPPALARSAGSGRRGSRRSPRCSAGTPAPRRSPTQGAWQRLM